MQSTGYSPRSAQKGQDIRRMVVFAILSVVAPPVGILCVWRSRRTNMAMRAALSAAGFLVMTVAFTLIVGKAPMDSIRPAPYTPQVAGYTTAEGVGSSAALEPGAANQPFFLSGATAKPGEGATGDGTDGIIIPSVDTAGENVTFVYAVNSGASLYHNVKVCNGQTNGISKTLEQATAMGMKPCPICYPPTDPAANASPNPAGETPVPSP